MTLTSFQILAAIAALCCATPALALHASNVGTAEHKVYGYNAASTNTILIEDLKELSDQVGPGKVVIFGGVHGYQNTGVPTASHSAHYACGDMAVDENEIRKQFKAKYKKEINFVYVNVGKTFATKKDGELTDKGLNDLHDAATKRATGGSISYLAWCWAGPWFHGGGGR